MKKSSHSKAITAGIAGLAAGAVAGVAITALSDPKTRQKAKNKAEELGQQAQKTYQKASQQVQQAWKDADPQLRQAGQQLKHKLNTDQVKESIVDDFPEMAVKGGKVEHIADEITEQYKDLKDLTNH